jgi:hypothetical protein
MSELEDIKLPPGFGFARCCYFCKYHRMDWCKKHNKKTENYETCNDFDDR